MMEVLNLRTQRRVLIQRRLEKEGDLGVTIAFFNVNDTHRVTKGSLGKRIVSLKLVAEYKRMKTVSCNELKVNCEIYGWLNLFILDSHCTLRNLF